MPGSRVKEVRMNLPAILESAGILGSDYEYLLPVATTLDREFLQGFIDRKAEHKITLVPETLPALYHSRAGIIASGTATVEAAMMKLPFVMVYRVSPLTYMLGKPRVKVPQVCHGQFDCGRRSRPRTRAGRFHGSQMLSLIFSEILLTTSASPRCCKAWRRSRPDSGPRSRLWE